MGAARKAISADVLAKLVDAVDAGAMVLDSRGRIALWNEWMAQASGISPERAEGMDIAALFPSVVGSRLAVAVDAVLRRGQSTILTPAFNGAPLPLNRIRRPSVRQTAQRLIIDVLTDNAGQRHCSILISDESESHAKTRYLGNRLRANQAQFAELVDSLPDAVVVFGPDLRISFLNVAAQQMFEVTSAAIHGCTLDLLYSTAHRLECAEVMQSLMSGGPGPRAVPVGKTLWGRRRSSGHSFPIEATLNEFLDESGRDSLILVARDVSKKRALEQEAFQSRKLDAIGHLTGGIAHDFNNLLAIIRGNIEFSFSSSSAEYAAACLNRAINVCDRAADLTQRLLSFARERQLEPQVFALGDVIKELEQLVWPLLPKSISLAVSCPPDPLFVKLDRLMLENAILNLCINARDAMPSGGEIRIRYDAIVLRDSDGERPAGRYVSLQVEDTGCGMSPEIASRAFEPFYTTKGVGKGSGLGLSTVYGFAEQSGGAARIQSTVGNGTTITLLFPQHDTPATIATRPDRPVDADPDNKVILLVEDQDELRNLTAAQLRSLGYLVEEAADANSALAILKRSQVDLLITDIVMPGSMDGIALSRAALRARPQMRLLLVSGHTREVRGVDEILALGWKLLSKPFRLSALTQAVRDTLNGHAL